MRNLLDDGRRHGLRRAGHERIERGTWSSRFQTQFCDGGDGASLGNACPTSEPQQGSPCPLSGTACEYATCPGGVSTSYDTNCLCVSGTWDCATFAGCDGG
ncbi:MAG TPA: hypothetical protein VIY73_26395, partial [Polyangiaceae bacterium]